MTQSLFLVGSHVFDFIGDNTIAHDAIRSFDKSKFIDLGKGGKRSDQTDVRSFRRFNRANTSIVAGMNVAHFKSCSIAVQAARSKRGKTSFVGQFGNRVGLIHKLRKLRTAEEVF